MFVNPTHDLYRQPWAVSLHGGHSGEYCDHGHGTLRETVEAAAARGYVVFGVTEHAPRVEPRFLFAEERARGWDVAKLERDFAEYAAAVRALADEYADRLTVLCGFEAEVVPADRYPALMRGYRNQYGFDYMVGSVHWVDEVIVDYTRESFEQAVTDQGTLERLAVRYYETVAEMVEALVPEVVGHLDLLRKYAQSPAELETPAVRRAALGALETIRDRGAVLDANTGGLRRGLGGPYPAPWLVRAAHALGIGFCFGDDSHAPDQVGAGLSETRQYLLEHGVDSIIALTREDGAVVRRVVPL